MEIDRGRRDGSCVPKVFGTVPVIRKKGSEDRPGDSSQLSHKLLIGFTYVVGIIRSRRNVVLVMQLQVFVN